jgi:hypothetical protein
MTEEEFTPLVGKTIAGYLWLDQGDEYSDGPWLGEVVLLIFTDGTTMRFREGGQAGKITYRWGIEG